MSILKSLQGSGIGVLFPVGLLVGALFSMERGAFYRRLGKIFIAIGAGAGFIWFLV